MNRDRFQYDVFLSNAGADKPAVRPLAKMLMGEADPIDERTGSTLAGSVVFFCPSLKNGDPHRNIDLPIARLGRAEGALKVRRSCDLFGWRNTHVAELHLSTLRWFALRADDFNGLGAKPIRELS